VQLADVANKQGVWLWLEMDIKKAGFKPAFLVEFNRY
jgi:hypothetical protein